MWHYKLELKGFAPCHNVFIVPFSVALKALQSLHH